MSFNPLIVQDSGRGPVYLLGSVSWYSPDGAPGFGSDAIRNALSGTAKTQADLAADMLPERVPARLFALVGGNVLAITRGAIDAGRAEARAAQEADSRMMEPAMPVDPSLAADIWSGYRSMDNGARAASIGQADLTDLTALVTFGNRVPLDETMWQMAVERYRVENWIDRVSLAASHPSEVSMDHILAIGPDMDAARQESRALMAQHAARLEAVKANEATAQNLIVFLATVFAMTPETVLDHVMGRADAQAA